MSVACGLIIYLLSYLAIYALLVLVGATIFSTSQFAWIGGTVSAARSIHDRLVRSILHTTLRFLDKTPVGRIIQRFTKDVSAIDNLLSRKCHNTIQLTLHLIGRLIIIVAFAPSFLVPGIAVLVIGGLVGQLYIKTQLPVKRCAQSLSSRWLVTNHPNSFYVPFLQRNEQFSSTSIVPLWRGN